MTAQGRWSCGKCGRFIADAAVHSEDHLDPGSYYGVTSTTTAECGHCGQIEGLDVRMSVWGYDDEDGGDTPTTSGHTDTGEGAS